MPNEKTKIRVRIRKSRSGVPYSDVTYKAPRSMMSPTNEPSLFEKPAVRAGLLIGAAVIALIAAALLVVPFGPDESPVTAQSNDAETPPLSLAEENEGGREPSATAEESQVPPLAAPPPPGSVEPLPADAEVATPSIVGAEEPSAASELSQTPSGAPTLEALEAEEARKALHEREAEGVSAVREALTGPQLGEAPSPRPEPSSLTQAKDVTAPPLSGTPEPPMTAVPTPTTPAMAEAEEPVPAPGPEEAMESEDVPSPEAFEPSSSVARAQFARGIVEREPVDPIDSVFRGTGEDSDKVYYFTELIGLSGHTITHRWEYRGDVVATVPFEVRGDRWRVYSSKTLLPSMAGQWRVVVVDTQGNPLQVSEFTYSPPES